MEHVPGPYTESHDFFNMNAYVQLNVKVLDWV